MLTHRRLRASRRRSSWFWALQSRLLKLDQPERCEGNRSLTQDTVKVLDGAETVASQAQFVRSDAGTELQSPSVLSVDARMDSHHRDRKPASGDMEIEGLRRVQSKGSAN